MLDHTLRLPSRWSHIAPAWLLIAATWAACRPALPLAVAQQPDPIALDGASQAREAGLGRDGLDMPRAVPAAAAPTALRVNEEAGINSFTLMIKGGWLTVPIGLLSPMAVTIAIERGLVFLQRAQDPDGRWTLDHFAAEDGPTQLASDTAC